MHKAKLEQLKNIHKFDERIMNIVTFISVLYVIFLIVELYLPRTQYFAAFIVLVDTVICAIFLFEFFYFLFKAKNKMDYTKKNFIDLLASLPFLLLMGAFTQVIVLNIFKMIRGFKNLIKIFEYLKKKKVSSLATILVVFGLIIVYFSISIVYFEHASNPAIDTFQDGLWWAVSTVTTVGYGDATPITMSGKVVAILLMLLGVGVTSAISAILVSFLLKSSQAKTVKNEQRLETKEDLSLRREKYIIKEQEDMTEVENKILLKMNKLEKKLDKFEKTSRKKKTKNRS